MSCSVGVSRARIEQACECAEIPNHVGTAECAECHADLHDGAMVTVLACRDAPDDCWRIDRVWCVLCAEYEFDALSLDVEGPRALVEGDVVTVMDGANQTHWPALARAELVDHTEVERMVA